MLSRILFALGIALFCGIGFYIPDYVKGTLDRADIAVPMMAYIASYITLSIRDRHDY